MKEFTHGFFAGLVLLVPVVIYFAIHTQPTTKIIRDCSITGVHIIADETVVVCRVVKVRTQEVPSPTNTKPEVTL
jgi:hypothetical protein